MALIVLERTERAHEICCAAVCSSKFDESLVTRPSVHQATVTFFIGSVSTIDQDAFPLGNKALGQYSARLRVELSHFWKLSEQLNDQCASSLWEAVCTAEADIHTADKMEDSQTTQRLYTFGEVFCKFSS